MKTKDVIKAVQKYSNQHLQSSEVSQFIVCRPCVAAFRVHGVKITSFVIDDIKRVCEEVSGCRVRLDWSYDANVRTLSIVVLED